MVLLKSVLAGLGAVAVGILGMVLYVRMVLYVQGEKYPWGTSVGIDFRAILFTLC